jgi:hypothetical protein
MTEAVLEWTEDKVKELVTKFRNRDIAFVEDSEIINVVKEQRKTPEWEYFKQNVEDQDIRILFQMGLTLRKLEQDIRKREDLRNKIFKKYDKKGLHVAEVVQNGIFSRFLGTILERSQTPQKLKEEILDLFKNIDNRAVFIQARYDEKYVKRRTDEIVAKINAHSPDVFVISSVGRARDICKKIAKSVMNKISDYTYELVESENKRIYFIIKR